MRIAITNVQVPFIHGGAELQATHLWQALREAGHEAELVNIPFKWYPPERISDHMLACRLLDLTEANLTPIDCVIGLKFPAYLVPHPNKVLWVIHQHRTAYDLWGHELGDIHRTPEGALVRQSIRDADCTAMREARHVFSESRNVAKRLMAFNGIDSEPLYHPPPHPEAFHTQPAEPFFFFPSRLSPIKRQELVVRALPHCRNPVRVCFAGVADAADFVPAMERLAQELGVDSRITWLGGISEEDKRSHYARCLAVVYVPYDEDYGYVTLEACLSGKAVVTVNDAGGVLEFIRHGETGLVAAPEPEALAEALDTLWEDRARARRLGENARASYDSLNITWPHVVERLLACL